MERKSLEFKCCSCGGNKLAYHSQVKSMAPVEIRSSGRVHYGPVIIDTSDCPYSGRMFCCAACRVKLVHNNRCVMTENQLRTYLKNTLDNYRYSFSEAEEQELHKLMDRTERDGVFLSKKNK